MAKLYVNPKVKKGHINPEIQGHFSEHLGRCIYNGIFVGENSNIPNVNGMRTDVVEALKEIKIPVLRWPGGCFADEYHWKDGIGPKESRKKMINTHWGGVVEDNSFGTHEFMELCRQLGCKTYINGNLGSGTVQEMSEWVEYMTFDGVSPMADLREKNGHKEPWTVDYFAIGNENWGCGGNMRPQYYGDLYRRYQTYVRDYNSKKPITKIACGPNSNDYHWTKTVLETLNDHGNVNLKALSLHYYTVPYGNWVDKGAATKFTEKDWYETMYQTYQMEELVTRHGAIMDQFDPEKKIGLMVDEWGTWFNVEEGTNLGFLYQQNTMRDALVAGINLNIFNKHCDRVKMANIAQVVNVLQSAILTEGDKMVKTPTWHVFDLYKVHQDNELLDSHMDTEKIGNEGREIPKLTESVSLGQDGKVYMTITNLSLTDTEVVDSVFADAKIKAVRGKILTGQMKEHNTFEHPEVIASKEFSGWTVKDAGLEIVIPPCSVVALELEI